jgi:hypothetical protein
MVWEDSVVLADLWLQGVATWSFAPLLWAMFGHGHAHRHLRPCLKSRLKHIFSLHLESTRRRRAHGVFVIVLALGIRLYYSIKISSSSLFKMAVSRALVYLVYLHLVTFEVVIEELKQWQCSLWAYKRKFAKSPTDNFGRWRASLLLPLAAAKTPGSHTETNRCLKDKLGRDGRCILGKKSETSTC